MVLQIFNSEAKGQPYGIENKREGEDKEPGDHCEYECVWGGERFRKLLRVALSELLCYFSMFFSLVFYTQSQLTPIFSLIPNDVSGTLLTLYLVSEYIANEK